MTIESDKNKKNKPERFFGKLKDISVSTIIDYIRYSCIVHISSDNNNAALFFIEGKLTDVRLNNEMNIKAIEEIKKWNNGSFSFCKWENNTETKLKYLQDILYLVYLLNDNCKLSYNNKNTKGEIHIEKGKIIKAVFNDIEGKDALNKILHLNKGILVTELNKQKKGNLNLTYNDFKTKYLQTIKKAELMNVEKLNQSLEKLKNDLGDALIASNIWTSADGQTIAAVNSQPKAAALFNQISQSISKTLTGSGFPGLNAYYLADLENESMVLVLLFKDYQWGILVESNKVQLGLLLNVILPNAKADFTDALK